MVNRSCGRCKKIRWERWKLSEAGTRGLTCCNNPQWSLPYEVTNACCFALSTSEGNREVVFRAVHGASYGQDIGNVILVEWMRDDTNNLPSSRPPCGTHPENMASLVNYSDTDSEEAVDEADSSQPPAKKQKTVNNNDKKSELPPLPASFLDQYSSTVRTSTQDDSSLHGGRKRITPHIEGNWPTHVYLECK